MARCIGALRRSPTLLLVAALLAVAGHIVTNGLGHWPALQQAEQLAHLADGMGHLSKAMQNLAFERGRANVVLRGDQPISVENRRFLDSRRSEGSSQVRQAVEHLRPLLPVACGDLEQRLAALDTLRQTVDANAALPKAQRPAGLSERWFGEASGVISGLLEVQAKAIEQAGDSDAAFASLARIALLSLQFRDTAGMESAALAGALADGGPSPERRRQLAVLRGQGDLLWLMLQRETVGLERPAVAAARDAVVRGLIDGLRPLQSRILAAWDAGTTPPAQVREYTQASVAGLDAVVNLTGAALHAAGVQAAERRRQAVQALAVDSGLLLLLLLAGMALPRLACCRSMVAPAGEAMAEVPAVAAPGEMPAAADAVGPAAALAATGIGVAELDAAGRVVWNNAEFARLLGRGSVSLAGYGLGQVLPVDSLEAAVPRGDWLYPVTLGGGSVLSVRLATAEYPFVCLRDARVFASVEAERDDLARRLAVILDNSPAGVVGVDRDGYVTFSNGAAQRILGVTTEQLLGRDFHAITHHSRADGTPWRGEDCPLLQTLADGSRHETHGNVFWRADGTAVTCHLVVAPLRDGRGILEGAVVLFAAAGEEVRCLPARPADDCC